MATNPICLDFVQGDTIYYTFVWQDDDGNAMNLSNATISSDIRKEYNTDVLASFSVVNTDLASGEFALQMDASTTATLPKRRNSRITSFVWDVNVVHGNGHTQTPITGYLKMIAETSK